MPDPKPFGIELCTETGIHDDIAPSDLYQQAGERHRNEIILIRGEEVSPQGAWNHPERAAAVYQYVSVIDKVDTDVSDLEHRYPCEYSSAASSASKRRTRFARSVSGKKAACAEMSICCFTSSSVKFISRTAQ